MLQSGRTDSTSKVAGGGAGCAKPERVGSLTSADRASDSPSVRADPPIWPLGIMILIESTPMQIGGYGRGALYHLATVRERLRPIEQQHRSFSSADNSTVRLRVSPDEARILMPVAAEGHHQRSGAPDRVGDPRCGDRQPRLRIGQYRRPIGRLLGSSSRLPSAVPPVDRDQPRFKPWRVSPKASGSSLIAVSDVTVVDVVP
jgi:hypothetical protein